MRHVQFSKGLNLVHGRNGKGKTTIIEGIYLCLKTKSFRTIDENNILKKGESFFSIDLTYVENNEENNIIFSYFNDQKIITENEKNVKNFARFRNRWNIELFLPEDINIISGPPIVRRRFLDEFIKEVEPAYPFLISEYERSLKARNKLLKRGDKSSLYVWDRLLAKYAESIVKKRMSYINVLNNRIKELSPYRLDVSIDIDTVFRSREAFLKMLNDRQSLDLKYGYTSAGIHRDNIFFKLNGENARYIASLGEKRVIINLIRYTMGIVKLNKFQVKPIFLMDDVGNELDRENEIEIFKMFKGFQTIYTRTEALNNNIEAREIAL